MVIKERFEEIVDNLKLKNQLKDDIDETVNQIINSNSRDFILSRGEYLNAKLKAVADDILDCLKTLITKG